MTLRYRVIIYREGTTFEGYVRAFPSLRVQGKTAQDALEAARAEIARVLEEYARDGRRPPTPDRDADVVELLDFAFEPKAQYRPKIQLDVVSGKVFVDGAEAAVRGSALALVVALACEPRDVSTETLSQRLYPGTAREQAYDALKMCVYRARKQLGGPGAIETTERGYRLADDVIVDIRFLNQIVRAIRSRSIAKAIEMRLDAIFEQLVGGRPAAYATWEWFAPLERTLCEAAREIGLYLADRALRAGDSERALQLARRLTEMDPLDETAHELAIRVHLARGDRASALQRFRRYADDLQAQHGMEPSPALRALVE